MSLQTPEQIRTLQRKLYVKAKQEPSLRFYLLYDKVYREDILAHAFALARANGGAPGVDGVTFEMIESQGLEAWLAERRRELHAKTYKPDPVRRVMIAKPGGGERPLGIPTLRDRVIQTAAKLVLEPIFEADFEDSAYGYRPKRSAQDAVRQVHHALLDGYTDVVDADLSKYFDTIPHRELMQCVARRVSDKQMLKLIKAWLKTPVEEQDEDGNRRMSGGKRAKRGVPQGGVASPLLSVIYMNRFLRAWRQRGKDKEFRARLVNFADDFVILSRGHASDALAWTRWAMTNIGLSLNETKTSIRDARSESFDFLGYTFGPERIRKSGQWYLAAQPSKKSVGRCKQRVRQILDKGNLAPWPEVADDLNSVLRGWSNYFGYGTRLMAYRAIDWYVDGSVRRFLRRRHQVASRATRQFPNSEIYGKLGVIRLRTLHVGDLPA
ncbi:MAG: group II intron reverse transcriptase/maturase [Actinobacteria bacterium]|nr:group II intron reverse transcriptase/maturase [Actinomycetota bacterium]